MSRLHENLGSQVLPKELENIGLENIPQYEYEDETQNKQSFPQLAEELEPIPDVADQYIGAKILSPRGDQMARCHVLAQSYSTNRNVVGRAHANPILDIRLYLVEFSGARLQI